MTVQTYHAALSMAHYGLGVALVDGCIASSADCERVEVLRLEPHIPVPIRVLRQADTPDLVVVRAITRAMKQALKDVC